MTYLFGVLALSGLVSKSSGFPECLIIQHALYFINNCCASLLNPSERYQLTSLQTLMLLIGQQLELAWRLLQDNVVISLQARGFGDGPASPSS